MILARTFLVPCRAPCRIGPLGRRCPMHSHDHDQAFFAGGLSWFPYSSFSMIQWGIVTSSNRSPILE